MIDSIPPGNEKHLLSRIYTGKELITALERVIELTRLENNDRITKTNKMAGTTEMTFNLNNLIILITLKMGDLTTLYLYTM